MKSIIIAGFAAIALLASCTHKEAEVAANTKFVLSDTMRNMIQIDTVKQCKVNDELTLSGVVGFNENNVVKVFPRSSGQVIEAKASLGDKVSKGQVLAVIHSADVSGAFNDLSSANADLSTAKRQMDNVASLYKNGISSEKDFNESKQNYEKALAVRNKIQSVININGGGKSSETGRYNVVAPIDGYIVEKKITAGAFIRPDMSENMFTISDLKNVWVYANVFEADISKIKEGYAVQVLPLSYPDRKFKGTINKVSDILDPQSKTMKVRIDIDNSERLLKPDMFTKVIVNNQEGVNAICIPASAIISQDGRNYVVQFNSNEDMHIAEVVLIKTVEGRSFVKGGIKEGQLLITRNQLFIFNQLMEE